jgi:hypothetical protein
MDVTRNVICKLPVGVNAGDLSIFIFPGRTLGKANRRLLTDDEYHLIQMNCEEVQPFIE